MLYGYPSTPQVQVRDPEPDGPVVAFVAGEPQDGDVILAVQGEDGYPSTDASVRGLWIEVPDETIAGAAMTEGEWVNPIAPEPSPDAPRWKTVSKFMLDLGLTNLVGIQTAANDSDDPRRPVAQIVIQFTNVTPNVNVNDPDTGALLDTLIGAGFITAEDKARALA